MAKSGRRAGLKILFPAMGVPVRSRPGVQIENIMKPMKIIIYREEDSVRHGYGFFHFLEEGNVNCFIAEYYHIKEELIPHGLIFCDYTLALKNVVEQLQHDYELLIFDNVDAVDKERLKEILKRVPND